MRVAGLGRIEVPTDVVAAPSSGDACSIRSGTYLRANDPSSCTLAWLADRPYLIGCAHTFFTPSRPTDPNDGIGVRIYDTAQHRHVRVGWVDRWSGIAMTGINRKDDARAALSDGVAVDHLRAGPARLPIVAVRNFDPAWSGTYVYFAASGEHRCTTPVARAEGDPLQMILQTPEGTVTTLYGGFYTLSMVAGDSVEPGDSGAAIYRPTGDGLEWAGVLFGRLGPGLALAFSARTIATRHDVPLN